MHACFQHQMKTQRRTGWLTASLPGKSEPTLFKPHGFTVNSTEDASSGALRALCFVTSLHTCTGITVVLERLACCCTCACVCVCAYAAAELMRDQGFQGFRCWCFERKGEWQGSWIVMADSCSLTKRLSISRQTGNSSPSPMRSHTCT